VTRAAGNLHSGLEIGDSGRLTICSFAAGQATRGRLIDPELAADNLHGWQSALG
jgi:hypothetical protein